MKGDDYVATYVMSDIHGCLTEVKQMLELINFSDSDRLIFAGDYVDRGPQSKEMLDWAMNAPKNMLFLRGNHDEGFADDIATLEETSKQCTDLDGAYVAAMILPSYHRFDPYETISEFLYEKDIAIEDFVKYKDWIKSLPYHHKETINDKNFIIVHAGYIDEKDFRRNGLYHTVEEYWLWARDEAYYPNAGVKDTIIVAGHTPTVIPGEFCYTDGDVYKQYNESLNCTLYDIDCGCVFGVRKCEDSETCKLACIRLEDEKIFYVKPNR